MKYSFNPKKLKDEGQFFQNKKKRILLKNVCGKYLSRRYITEYYMHEVIYKIEVVVEEAS